MEKLRRIACLLLSFALFVLAGCGGGGSGTGGAFGDSAGTGTSSTLATPPAGTAASYTLSLNTDIKTVDVNIGTVLATATLKTQGGTVVPDQAVTFAVLAGPATVGTTTPVTDVNGLAKAIVTTQDTPFTTNVLLEAKTTVLGVTYRAYASIQIVRGTGVISIAPLGVIEKTYAASVPTGTLVGFVQLIPFKLTDSNGNPRVGVPVTLSTLSQTGDSATITIASPGATVTTDSAGEGIFNVTISGMSVPPAGTTNTSSVVFKAVTNDLLPVTAYMGGMYSVTHSSL